MENQLPKPKQNQNLSHNVYNRRSVGQRNILNGIINSSYPARLTYSDHTPITLRDAVRGVFEFLCIGTITVAMCYFIAVSDAFDQHLIELVGR